MYFGFLSRRICINFVHVRIVSPQILGDIPIADKYGFTSKFKG